MTARDTVRASIEANRDSLVALSHYVHEHPEINYQEFHSCAAVADATEQAGFVVERNAGGLATAFRATKGTGSLHIVFCAEYDALPDVGHACGHNIIAASSVGAAIGLASVADELDLRVTLLGTPAEEGGGGKIDLLRAGYFKDEHVAMMIHPWPSERLEATCLAVDAINIAYVGKEAHASAAPWEGVNALDALNVAQVAIGFLRQQLRPGDQVHGHVLTSGSAANIIPSSASADFMIRSLNNESLDALRARVIACFEAGALATGAKLTVTNKFQRFSHMVSHQGVLAHYRRAAEALGRNFDLDDAGTPLPTISTDMANVSLELPSIHPLLMIPTNGAVNHQPEFTAACATPDADAAVIDGALALAWTAIGVAEDSALRQELMA
jgi:amidohydrolase